MIADSEIRKILWSTEYYLQAVLEYCGVGTEVLTTTTRAPGKGELMKKRDHPCGSGIVVVF